VGVFDGEAVALLGEGVHFDVPATGNSDKSSRRMTGS